MARDGGRPVRGVLGGVVAAVTTEPSSLIADARYEAILAARRVLLRHSDQFYGPLKDCRCACSACKAIRGLLDIVKDEGP